MTDQRHYQMACRCQSDPFTWTVDDPFDGLVICFGCRDCGTSWTRIAPDPMQKQHRRSMKKKAAAELVRLGYPA